MLPRRFGLNVRLREEQLGRRSHLDLVLVGGTAETVPALLPRVAQKTGRSYLDVCLRHYHGAAKALMTWQQERPGQRSIRPQYLVKIINEVAAGDAVFTVDVGTLVIWAARYLTMNGQRRVQLV